MRRFAYSGPDGELVVAKSLSTVLRFLGRNRRYWNWGGSGSAVIGRLVPFMDADGEHPGWQIMSPRLHIVVHQPYGVQLTCSLRENAGGVTTYEESKKLDMVEHQLGGNRVYFPRRSFISQDLAEGAIEHFLHTGKKAPSVRWRKGRFVTERFFEFVDD